MMRTKLFFCILLLIFLCGCSYSEPDARYTVTALGFSKEGENVSAVLQAVEPSAGETPSELKTFTVRGKGETVKEAVASLSSLLSKKPSFGHCRLLVFSEGCDVSFIGETFEFCHEADLPLSADVSVCNNVEKLLKNEELPSGEDLLLLIRSSTEAFGFGGHSSLFEIEAAVGLKEDFALPRFYVGEEISLDGLLAYRGGRPYKKLNVEESRRYAEKNDLKEEKGQ